MSSWATKPQAGKNATITALGGTSKSAMLNGSGRQFYRVVVAGGSVHLRTGASGDAAVATDPVYEEGTELIAPASDTHTHLHALAVGSATGIRIDVCPVVAVRQ